MRNVFLFFRRYSNFFLFLFLQVVCLTIVFRFNRFHNAMGMTMASRISGYVHEKTNAVTSFFTLQRTNDSLVKRMAEMQNARPANYLPADTSTLEKADFIPVDTLGHFKKILRFIYRPATVIYKTENDDFKNYIMLARGVNEGVNIGQAVVGAESNAVIGKVVYADARYAMVMPLIHHQSSVPAKMARTGETGNVIWSGGQVGYVTLNRIPKTAKVQPGDTVLTSNSSDIFPPNLQIGTVYKIDEEKSTGNLRIRVKTRVDFYNVQYVYVIENLQQKEMQAVLQQTKNQLNKPAAK
jgi:rod shape-determining protein MreC